MAIGTSGNQFKNAGVIGKVMGDIIYMNDMGVNTDVENISSYMPNIKEIINFKSFSRLRELLDTNKSVWS
jgi:sarcosine oxidase subunit beta